MKTINTYINEKLVIGNNIDIYNYHPKDKDELIACIKDKTKNEGYGTKDKPLDLNDIDTSKVTDMWALFDCECGKLKYLAKNGYFDISKWDVSNVKNMFRMLAKTKFDGDLSKWDVSNVKDMSYMFYNSDFTGENGDISDWDVSNVENTTMMFAHTAFRDNIDKWNMKSLKSKNGMFNDCPLENNLPKWYKQ